MADAEIGVHEGFAASGAGDADTPSNFNGGTDVRVPFDDDDMDTITAMRTRLQAIDATAYSDANLATMTKNDMIYALRVHDNPGTISSHLV